LLLAGISIKNYWKKQKLQLWVFFAVFICQCILKFNICACIRFEFWSECPSWIAELGTRIRSPG
jgi:hypothetical protein